MVMRVDAHHHLWRYTAEEFGWIGDDMQAIRRNFLASDLQAELTAAHVDGTVVVQARQSLAETDCLLSVARATPGILGVVGWLPLADAGIAEALGQYAEETLLKGVRHVVQAEARGFLDEPAFNHGVSLLKDAALAYDILILEQQLEEAARFVDRHPEQNFILDHLAKPRIAAGELEPWASQLRELAKRPRVSCKISGMVTEADPRQWTPAQLQPYFDTALEAFGPGRLMIGTDWPVLTVGCSYSRWWQIVESWTAPLTTTEREAILGGTAQRMYRLETAPLPAAATGRGSEA
jgi:L-fuconolactonase